MNMEYSIEIKGLRKEFGDKVAVKDLNLKIPEGSLFSMLGVNGAGKTTTIRMLTGLSKPTAGDATVMGHCISTDMDEIKKLKKDGEISEDDEKRFENGIFLSCAEHLEDGVHVAVAFRCDLGSVNVALVGTDDFKVNRTVVVLVNHGLEIAVQVDVTASAGLIDRSARRGTLTLAVADVDVSHAGDHLCQCILRFFSGAVDVINAVGGIDYDIFGCGCYIALFIHCIFPFSL